MIAQILFQLTSAVASVGRVKTSSHVVSRRFNALALGPSRGILPSNTPMRAALISWSGLSCSWS
jgi:hypothetical protein